MLSSLAAPPFLTAAHLGCPSGLEIDQFMANQLPQFPCCEFLQTAKLRAFDSTRSPLGSWLGQSVEL